MELTHNNISGMHNCILESSVYKTSDILSTLSLWWEEWGGTSLDYARLLCNCRVAEQSRHDQCVRK